MKSTLLSNSLQLLELWQERLNEKLGENSGLKWAAKQRSCHPVYRLASRLWRNFSSILKSFLTSRSGRVAVHGVHRFCISPCMFRLSILSTINHPLLHSRFYESVDRKLFFNIKKKEERKKPSSLSCIGFGTRLKELTTLMLVENANEKMKNYCARHDRIANGSKI